MPRSSFQRAREPAQKEQRRQELVHAAAELLAEGGLDAVTLSAIARAAGLAKSNVYRYFESREEILLEILLVDQRAWIAELEHALAPLAGSGDADAVAAAIARTISARPITCELLASMAGVLERNLAAATVLEFKARLVELTIRIRNAVHAALPALPLDQSPVLLRCMHALVAGLWPMAHPPPGVADAITEAGDAGLAALCTTFEPDLRDGCAALLRGLLHRR